MDEIVNCCEQLLTTHRGKRKTAYKCSTAIHEIVHNSTVCIYPRLAKKRMVNKRQTSDNEMPMYDTTANGLWSI